MKINIPYILFIVAVFGFWFYMEVVQQDNNTNKVNEWASKNDLKATEIYFTAFDNGPYFIRPDDNYSIAKVKMSNGRTYWFRFNMFSTDVEEAK